jgi:hypothetical protein
MDRDSAHSIRANDGSASGSKPSVTQEAKGAGSAPPSMFDRAKMAPVTSTLIAINLAVFLTGRGRFCFTWDSLWRAR